MSDAHPVGDRTRGVVPAVNDLLAGATIAVVYFIRIASVAEPAAPLPWYLMVTTDAVLPILAAAWLFGGALYALADHSDGGLLP